MIRFSMERRWSTQGWRIVAAFAHLADGLVGLLSLGLLAGDFGSAALTRVLDSRLRR